jgi:hypothetical protein
MSGSRFFRAREGRSERLAASLIFSMLCVSGAYAGSTTVTMTSPPSIAAGAVSQPLNFSLTRSGDTTYDVVLSYHTVDATAHAGIDYVGAASNVLMPAGVTTKTVAVTVNADPWENPPFNAFKLYVDGGALGTLPAFGGQQIFTVGTSPSALATGDLNGDGLMDTVIANDGANTVSVFFNTTTPGAAAPSFTTEHSFATGAHPQAVSLADINGDGLLDLLVADSNDATVSVLLNTTAPGALVPSFAARQAMAVGSAPRSIAIADLNADGKLDLVSANSGGATVSVLFNTTTPGAATPTFSAQQTLATGTTPVAVVAADLDGDGRPDLVVANNGADTLSVLLNTATPGASVPSFGAQQTVPTGSHPSWASVADVNGDGRPDLVVANHDANSVGVLLNLAAAGNATVSFAAQQSFPVGAAPTQTTLADVNGDGLPDVLVGYNGGSSVAVLLDVTAPGASAANFAAAVALPVGAGLHSVAATDFNGDGKPDLVATNGADGTMSVLLNTRVAANTAPPLAAKQDFASAFDPVGLAVPYFVTTADLNGDGKPDMIVVDSDAANSNIGVFFNTTLPGVAAPTFGARQIFATGSGSQVLAVADFNADGKLDLAVQNRNAGTLSVLLNTAVPGAGAPSFAAQQILASGADAVSIAAADLNGDGRPDLAVALHGSTTLGVLLNTTAPGANTVTFTTQQTFSTGTAPFGVAIADINGDGRSDLISANNGAGTVAVLLNTTTPGAALASFATQMTFAAGSFPQTVTTADLNGDGRMDLITSDTGDNTVGVLLNTTAAGATTPSFAAKQTFVSGALPIAVIAADLNGDGRRDLITANFNASSMSVLRNTTAIGASTASFAAQQSLAAGYEPISVGVADVNGDGSTDVLVANLGDKSVSIYVNTRSQIAIASNPATGTVFHDIIFIDEFQ